MDKVAFNKSDLGGLGVAISEEKDGGNLQISILKLDRF